MVRESRYVKIARVAYHLVSKELPLYSHPKSPHRYTFPQLVSCVLMMFYMGLSYRDMEEWLLATDKVCKELKLKRVPDHSTLCRTYRKITKAYLDKLLRRLLEMLDIEEEFICADSTGFRESNGSAYYLSRAGRKFKFWRKGVYAVGCRSQMILAFLEGKGPASDTPFLPRIKRKVSRWGRKLRGRRAWMLIADRGFDGKMIQEGDLIPPIRRGGAISDPPRRMRAALVDAARSDGIYGQRWKAETVISVIKRKFGDSIRSRVGMLKRREVYVLGLVYNLHR